MNTSPGPRSGPFFASGVFFFARAAFAHSKLFLFQSVGNYCDIWFHKHFIILRIDNNNLRASEQSYLGGCILLHACTVATGALQLLNSHRRSPICELLSVGSRCETYGCFMLFNFLWSFVRNPTKKGALWLHTLHILQEAGFTDPGRGEWNFTAVVCSRRWGWTILGLSRLLLPKGCCSGKAWRRMRKPWWNYSGDAPRTKGLNWDPWAKWGFP